MWYYFYVRLTVVPFRRQFRVARVTTKATPVALSLCDSALGGDDFSVTAKSDEPEVGSASTSNAGSRSGSECDTASGDMPMIASDRHSQRLDRTMYASDTDHGEHTSDASYEASATWKSTSYSVMQNQLQNQKKKRTASERDSASGSAHAKD